MLEPVMVDEALNPGVTLEEAVMEVSRRKVEAAEKTVKRGWIIGADTVITIDGEALGKPSDDKEAAQMMRRLSGRTHRVLTGFTIAHQPTAAAVTDVVSTEVDFYPLSEEEVQEYVNAGEYRDKAGGYGAQGLGALLIREYRGCFFNVVGLPLAKLRRRWRELCVNIGRLMESDKLPGGGIGG